MVSTYFTPVSLPNWEKRLSFAVWTFHSLAAFVIAYNVSTGSLSRWIGHWLEKSSYSDDLRIDNSDNEWKVFRLGVYHMASSNLFNSLGFYLITKLFDGAASQILLVTLGIATQVHMTSLRCMAFVLLFSLVVVCLAKKTQSKTLVWVLCIAFVIKAHEYLPYTVGLHTFYREFNVYLYNAFKLLNFCLYLCRNPEINYRDIFMEHMLYVSYLPYSMSLIVRFEDFQNQIRERLKAGPQLPNKNCLIFGLRVIFWMFVYDILLHFIHVNALFNSPFTVIDQLDKYELASVAYVAGQFFHLKYVVIFGLPSFFAMVDGMIPPPPPICISRVSRYSRMWRHFDYGLYQFLKHNVYLPLMMPVLPLHLSILRGLGTLVAVFSVVIAWHGLRFHTLCWVSLSALELIIEKIGKAIWSTEQFQQFKNRIGELNTRRIIAIGMLATVIPGIFGVFFFLGQEGIGETVFSKLLYGGLKDMLTLNVRIDRQAQRFTS
ncbi:unnamed protein product [Auanema sp. JU1783]|nr:unnamed protein product [Auanema sp. JU1783]